MQGNMPRLTKAFCLSLVMIFPWRLEDWACRQRLVRTDEFVLLAVSVLSHIP